MESVYIQKIIPFLVCFYEIKIEEKLNYVPSESQESQIEFKLSAINHLNCFFFLLLLLSLLSAFHISCHFSVFVSSFNKFCFVVMIRLQYFIYWQQIFFSATKVAANWHIFLPPFFLYNIIENIAEIIFGKAPYPYYSAPFLFLYQ